MVGTSQDGNGGASTGYQLPAVAWGMDEDGPEGLSGPAGPAAPASVPEAEAAPAAVAAPAAPAKPVAEPDAESEPKLVPEPKPKPTLEPESKPESAAPARPGAPGAARLVALKRAITQAPARAARTLASVAPSAAGPAATGSGTSSTDEAGAPEPAEERSGRRRVPRPAVAAAAVGVVLMGLPLVMGRGEVGTDAVEPLGGTGTSRPDTPAPEPDAPGTPTGTPATPAATTGLATPSGTPTDPAATPAPGTPAPGAPDQQPAPGAAPAAGAPAALAVGAAPAVRAGNGAADRPATGSQSGPAPQAPAQPPAQPAAPQPPQQPQQSSQQPPAVPAPPAAPSYAGEAGPGCATTSTGYRENGRSAGSRDWVTNYDGGTDCGGDYTSVPMSGDRNKDDGNSVFWTFSTGPVSSGSCRVSVYIPNNRDLKAVGGAPAYYTVQNGSSPGSGTIGSFTINQPQNLGQWVSAGTYQLSGNRVGVVLHTRGIDWGSTAGARLAASTVKVDCTG